MRHCPLFSSHRTPVEAAADGRVMNDAMATNDDDDEQGEHWPLVPTKVEKKRQGPLERAGVAGCRGSGITVYGSQAGDTGLGTWAWS